MQYDRRYLRKTLEDPLRKTILDTIKEIEATITTQGVLKARAEPVNAQFLELEVQGLKSEVAKIPLMISEAVNEALSKAIGPSWPSPAELTLKPPKANAKLNWLSIFLSRD